MILVPRATLHALVRFGQLVSDSECSRSIFDLLARTVVEGCAVPCVLVFEVGAEGDFRFQSSHGGACEIEIDYLASLSSLSIDELSDIASRACRGKYQACRSYPLISDSALFGALVVLFSNTEPLNEWQGEIIQEMVAQASTGLSKIANRERFEKAAKDLQTSQDILARSERLRMLGQMSASISHDIKNILVPLSMQLDFLNRVAAGNEAVIRVADRFRQSVRHGIEILERLRDFSRQSPDTAKIDCVDLSSLVREAFEICRPRAPGGVSLSLELGEPSLVFVSASELVSAIVNLMTNAIDALGPTGAIWVRTGASEKGGWVTVGDNGPGIPEAIQSRIFEPFYTTKGAQGTGLGLSMVYALAQRHHGQLTLQSAPGKGAIFTLCFPREENRSRALENPRGLSTYRQKG